MPQWLRAAFGGHILPAREAFPVESYVGAGTDKKQHEGKSKRAIDSTVHAIGYTPHQQQNGTGSILLALPLVSGGHCLKSNI